MRRIAHALTFILVSVGLVAVGGPAEAAPKKPGVTIVKSTIVKPSYGASTVIKPKYRKGPRTKIVSAKVTVKGTARTGKSVKASGKTVRVTAGTYKVTTKVVFKIKKSKKSRKWSGKKSKSKTWTYNIAQGPKNCATMADYNAIRVGDDDNFGSFKPEVQKLMAQVGASDGPITLEDMYYFLIDAGDYDTAEYVLHLAEVYGDTAYIEVVDYRMCASRNVISVMYIGYVRFDGVPVDEVIYKTIE